MGIFNLVFPLLHIVVDKIYESFPRICNKYIICNVERLFLTCMLVGLQIKSDC